MEQPAEAESLICSLQKRPEPFFKLGRVAKLAFPQYQHVPTLVPERSNVTSVARPVAGKFPFPKQPARLRQSRFPAPRMLMPKATVHENSHTPRRQHDVGTSGQIASVQTESVPPTVGQASHHQFRLR